MPRSTATEILKYLSNVKSGPRSKNMRTLIRGGLRDNQLPIGEGIPMRDVSTVNGLLVNCKTSGFRDFKFLKEISDDVIETIKVPAEGIRFLSNLTHAGVYDEKLVLQTLIRLMEIRKSEPFGPSHVAQIINVLARQRLRLEDLSNNLIAENFGRMTDSDKIRVLCDLASLKIPTERDMIPIDLPMDPSSCTDLLQYFLLSPNLMHDPELVRSRLNPALQRIADSFSNIEKPHAAWRKKLLLFREAARYVYPTAYAQLYDSGKTFLSLISMEDCSKKISHLSEDRMVKSVSDVLFKLKLKHDLGVELEPFSVDMQEAGRKIIWECDTPNRFYVGSDARKKTAYYSLRGDILTAMGYKVISIPHWHWARITTPSARSDYIRMCRHLAIAPSNGSGDNRDISLGTNYHRPEINSFSGESIFKKAVPKRSWAWHAHSAMPVRITI